MSSISSITEAIGAMSAGYETSDTVRRVLAEKELVPLIGPFAIGKTTLMRVVEQLNPAFGRVRSFTTRPQRPGEGDDTYEFLPHDEMTLRRILRQVEARELVQFTVHPTTGNIYGSTLATYHATYSMLDTMPTSLPGLVSLPFRYIRMVSITAPPDVWEGRMAERLHAGSAEDIKHRLTEGIANVTWSLDQGDSIAWVVNGAGDIRDAARELIRVVKKGHDPVASARETAARLLKRMQAASACLGP